MNNSQAGLGIYTLRRFTSDPIVTSDTTTVCRQFTSTDRRETLIKALTGWQSRCSWIVMLYTTVSVAALLGLFSSMPRVAVAQSDTLGLTARYGPPEVERYQVTPQVSLTVLYGRDRTVCQLSVEPRPSTSALKPTPAKEPPTISTDLVDSLLNELLPLGVRQGEARLMAQQMSCAALLSEDYDNVRIARATNECAPAAKNVESLTIQWKRPECPEQKTAH